MFRNLLVVIVIPALFVLIWSTGWAVILFVLPHADPMTFLSLRFAITFVVIALFAWFGGATFPTDHGFIARAIGSGVFLHGLYLCGVWWAIAHGVPAGISALISALQPLMTAVAAPYLLGERLSPIRIAGVVLGFAGIVIALTPQLQTIDAGNLLAVVLPILANVAGMAALTGGTFYQKRALAAGDLRIIVALQYVGAFAITLPLAYLFEPMHITWTLESSLAMVWNVLGISVGGIALLLFLIRRGEVSRAATLIYLVPPTAAVEIWLVRGTVMTSVQLIGMAVTVAGVALASRK
jgi:drug/metabolite transporter (DMT)-like permease